jgi:antitoxin component YwqK of YwqJK toxin-antitoxin module
MIINTRVFPLLFPSCVIIFCLTFKAGTAQTVVVNYYDSTLFKTYMAELEFPFKKDFFCTQYRFRDSLPDGTYYYYSSQGKKRVDETNIEDYYLSKGQYLNGLQNGRFQYFSDRCYFKRKNNPRVLIGEENYKDGLLHGYSFCGTCEFKLYEGNFKMGKRHGFFYEYDFFGNLILVELYQEGILTHRSELRDITILKK